MTATYEKFEKKGLQLPEQLRARAKSKLYATNEDKDTVWHSGECRCLGATSNDTGYAGMTTGTTPEEMPDLMGLEQQPF